MDISSILTGGKILHEENSKYNGHIVVRRDLAWGTYIQAEGLTQSGGVVETIWKSVLKKLQISKNPKLKTVLILGFGGGTIAKLIRKYRPQALITGVDIDPVIVELGKKYLGISYAKVSIADAFEKTQELQKSKTQKYDLVFVDLYQGYKYPQKFEEEKFIKNVKKLLSPDGTVVFNRLYMAGKRTAAIKFGKKLESIFKEVTWVYPEANLMFVCKAL